MRIQYEENERPILIQRLGLGADASEEELTSGLMTLLTVEAGAAESPPATPPAGDAVPPATTPPPAATTPPPAEDEEDNEEEPEPDENGQVLIDIAAWKGMKDKASLTGRLLEEDRLSRRGTLITAAIKEGKFPPSRRAHYEARFDSDEDATVKVIARMMKGAVPVDERGVDASEAQVEDQTSYPTEWLPEVHQVAAQKVQNGSQPQQVPVRPNRVTTED
jgi:hypothetical protein